MLPLSLQLQLIMKKKWRPDIIWRLVWTMYIEISASETFLRSFIAPIFVFLLKTNQNHPDAPRLVCYLYIKMYHFWKQNFSMRSQRGEQGSLACWTLVNSESDSAVSHSILLSGPQYLSQSMKQLIAWVPLLRQKIHKGDNVSNSFCFKKEKQLTREVECCVLKQCQFLTWLWGKAISHSTQWTKFRGTLPRAKSSYHTPRQATDAKGNEDPLPP